MKKILSILLITLMLVSAVSISAFADGTVDTISISGKWNIVSVPSTKFVDLVHVTFTFSNSKLYYGISSSSVLNNHISLLQEDGTFYTLPISTKLYIDFGDTPQDVPINFYYWLSSFAEVEIVECDGSSCHIKDVDFDEVCDTCGNAVTISMRSTSVNNWDEYFSVYNIAYPMKYKTGQTEGSVQDVFHRYHEQSNDAYAFIFKEGNTTYLRITDSDLYYNNGYLVFDKVTTDEKTYKYTQYTLGDDYWAYNGEFTIKVDTRFYPTNLYATQTTIFDLNVIPYMTGEGFFHSPPPKVEMGPVNIQEAGEQIRQVMMIAAIVAVSCLALWISFLILFRVLRTYLKQS